MKKGQVAIFIVVGVFIVGAIIIFAWLKSIPRTVVDERECSVDADCVPKECCNAELCAPISQEPECGQSTPLITSDDSSQFCQAGCDSFGSKALGCVGTKTGTCKCVDKKCAPSWP